MRKFRIWCAKAFSGEVALRFAEENATQQTGGKGRDGGDHGVLARRVLRRKPRDPKSREITQRLAADGRAAWPAAVEFRLRGRHSYPRHNAQPPGPLTPYI